MSNLGLVEPKEPATHLTLEWPSFKVYSLVVGNAVLFGLKALLTDRALVQVCYSSG